MLPGHTAPASPQTWAAQFKEGSRCLKSHHLSPVCAHWLIHAEEQTTLKRRDVYTNHQLSLIISEGQELSSGQSGQSWHRVPQEVTVGYQQVWLYHLMASLGLEHPLPK